MADSSSGNTAPTRVPMTMPGASYVVEVPEADVEHRLETGWKKVRGKRNTDTGSVPVQRTDPR